MTYRLSFWIITAFTAILRLLVIGRIGLTGDEAHYWTYTRYPQLSYFDHPPLVAWLINIFTTVFGNSEFAVRLPAVLIFAAVSYLLYRLTTKLFSEKTAFWTVALLNVMPVFSFLGAVMTIPDTPLSLFWIVFIYVFHKLITENKPYYWYVLGITLGLALLSKYNAVLLPVSAFIYLAFSKEHRFHLKRKEPYIALLIALAVFMPVVIWNIENGFASFGFQLRHGLGGNVPHFSFGLLAKCLGAQAAYVSPVIFIALWWALFAGARRGIVKDDGRYLLLFSFSAPTLLVFNAIACFNEILPHWPAMGYLLLVPAAAELSIKVWNSKWFRAAVVAGALIGVFLCVLIPLQAMFKVIPPEIFLPKDEALRLEDGITKAEKIDLTNELYGWREAGEKISEIMNGQAGPKPFVFTHRHYIASQLSFYIPGKPRVYSLSEKVDAYDFWQRDLSQLDGKDGIFVTSDYFYMDPAKVFPFASWEKPVEVDIYRAGRKIRIFWITVGRKFDLKKLPPEYTSGAAGPKLTLKQGIREMDYRMFWLFNRDIDVKPVDYMMWKFTRFDVSYGFNSGLVVLIVVVGVILWLTKREKFLAEFVLFIGIIGIGGVVVHLMKGYFDRMRPLVIFGGKVRVFHELLERGSFPSGHSQIAFSVATYLASRFKRYWWLFYSVALGMGLSRVYIGVHFPIDVLGGAIVGTLVAWIMIKLVKIESA